MGLSSSRGRLPRAGKSLRRSGLVQDLIVDTSSLSPLDKGSVPLPELSSNIQNKRPPRKNTPLPAFPCTTESTSSIPCPLSSPPPPSQFISTHPPHTHSPP